MNIVVLIYSLHTEPSHDINDLIVNWDQTDQYNYEINDSTWSTGTSTTFTIPSDNVNISFYNTGDKIKITDSDNTIINNNEYFISKSGKTIHIV